MLQVYQLPQPKNLKSTKFGETQNPSDTAQKPEYDNIIKRQPVRPGMKDMAERILPYGQNNAFPLVLAQLVQESPTASACITTISDFIEGSGFTDESIMNLKVNEQGDTFWNIHSVNAQNYSLFEGIALNIKYNGEFKISEIYQIPFENCRFAIPDENGFISKIRYNPYYGTSQFLRSWTEEYDVFNPDREVVARQMEKAIEKEEKYKGQILYFSYTRPLSRFYSMPHYYSSQYWMQVDAKIGQFHANNLNNGFYQSVLMKVIGDPNAPSNHPDDFTFDQTTKERKPIEGTNVGTRFDEEMQQFTGSERAGNIMVQWAKNKDEFPEVVPFPQQANERYFETLQNQVIDNICIATKVPSILAAFSTGKASLGGEGNMIRAAVKVMQQRVTKTQTTLEGIYKQILSNWYKPINSDVNITSYNPFPEIDKVDPLQWAALTVPEQRTWLKKNTDFPIDLNKMPTKPAAPVVPPLPVHQAKFMNIYLSDYPDAAKKHIKEALDYQEKTGNICDTVKGRQRAQSLLKGEPISYKSLKKMHNWLSKNQHLANTPMNESCDAVKFKAWGGMPMLKYCQDCIQKFEE